MLARQYLLDRLRWEIKLSYDKNNHSICATFTTATQINFLRVRNANEVVKFLLVLFALCKKIVIKFKLF